MSTLHKQAMEAVLKAAEMDILGTMEEQGVKERHSDEGDNAVLDVAISHAYRVFVRICESQGLTTEPWLFADMAAELAEEEGGQAEG